jgi:hypothetical protein
MPDAKGKASYLALSLGFVLRVGSSGLLWNMLAAQHHRRPSRVPIESIVETFVETFEMALLMIVYEARCDRGRRQVGTVCFGSLIERWIEEVGRQKDWGTNIHFDDVVLVEPIGGGGQALLSDHSESTAGREDMGDVGKQTVRWVPDHAIWRVLLWDDVAQRRREIDIEDFTAHKTAAQVIIYMYVPAESGQTAAWKSCPSMDWLMATQTMNKKRRKNDIFTSVW